MFSAFSVEMFSLLENLIRCLQYICHQPSNTIPRIDQNATDHMQFYLKWNMHCAVESRHSAERHGTIMYACQAEDPLYLTAQLKRWQVERPSTGRPGFKSLNPSTHTPCWCFLYQVSESLPAPETLLWHEEAWQGELLFRPQWSITLFLLLVLFL